MLYTGDKNRVYFPQNLFFDVYHLIFLEYGCAQTKKAPDNSKLAINWDIRLVISEWISRGRRSQVKQGNRDRHGEMKRF